MPPKKKEEKELDALKRQRKKAQDRNDLAEEAKFCNAIGEVYMRKGDYHHALHYHQAELALSEGGVDKLGAGIAHRRVGECLCEMGEYDTAIHHQMKHLQIAQETANLAEEQRALATLGRTYWVQSTSDEVGEEGARELRLHAGNAYLRSLDVCDKLGGVVPDKELLEMRSRLYLNLGLVYQTNGDLQSARKFMEKALSILRELGDSATISQCHFDLGSLYLLERRPALALRCFREALRTASEQRSWQQEAEVLREMSQAQLLMSNFHEAKSCLKKVVRLYQENSQLGGTEADQRNLNTVRKVVYYSLEMEALGAEKTEEKMKMCDKLGDLCCSIKAFPAAIKFYEQQLCLAEAHGVEPRQLSPAYISLARTHSDCCQYTKALFYYEKELELWRGNPTEECDTWTSIAEVRRNAGMESLEVVEAYHKAFKFAKESGNPRRKVGVCKAVVELCKSRSEVRNELSRWEGELESVLEQHPDITLDSSEDENDSEDTVCESGFETPESLSEMETDEEEEGGEEVVDSGVHTTQNNGTQGVAVRRKSRLFKRNEKGETLLHVAAIAGNLAAARQLISEGADVNTRDNCGWLPLHEACNHGHTEMVSFLLDSGASVNDSGGIHCGGVSPLIDAASSGHMDIVQLLVRRGADVFHKDAQGHTAVDMLTERLASAVELNESYELEEKHAAIRDYLRGEMKKRGWVEEDVVVVASVEVEGSRTLPRVRSKDSIGKNRGILGSSTFSHRSRVADRTGRDVLLSSDEEDSSPASDIAVTVSETSHHRNESYDQPTTSQAPSKPYSSSSIGHRDREMVCIASSRGNRQAKRSRPLEQTTIPALISVKRAGCDPTTGDQWLEDDMPFKKRKRQARDPFKADISTGSRGSRSRGLSSSLSLKRRPGGGKSRSTERILMDSTVSSTVVVSDSDEGTDTGDVDHYHHHDPAIAHRPLQLSTNPPLSQPTTPLPLRIRVKIDTKSYLIPCPAKLVDGSDSTIQWLSQQAAERYCTQQGVRPRLSLTTADGALLSTDDVIAHVLQSGEEVVGVVEHWRLPPLPQRYQTACTTAGLDCHQRILKLFQESPSAPVLDLSHLSLQPVSLPPLFTSLQGQSSLTSLILSGNRLKTDALSLLANALAHHPNLHVLDLSCTGITAQGLEKLCNPSPPSTSYQNTPPPSTPWSALRSLFLGYNPLGPDSGPALSTLLSLTPGLLQLGLQSCGLGERALERHTGLGQTLKGLSNLTDIAASLNPLQSSGVATLLLSLPTDHLSHLDLANTCTQQPLTDVLQQPHVVDFFKQVGTRLECLSFSHCRLDTCALCRCLQNCHNLQELRLAAVGLTMDSVHQLCSLVEHQSCLKLLDVSGNEGLRNQGCLELLQCCAVMADLRLNLAACGMCSPLPNELITTLSERLTKRRVEIVGNDIDQTDHMLMFSAPEMH